MGTHHGGFLSSQWGALQQQEYNRIRSRKSGQQWAAALIQKLWDTAWDQWNQRNSILHQQVGLDAYQDTTALDHRVRTEYQIGAPPMCPSRCRHLYTRSLSVILASSAEDRRRWIASARNVRSYVVQHYQTDMTAERRLMRDWLRQGTPPLNAA